jgi:sporulation protein YlmC with PRC-barrel domain
MRSIVTGAVLALLGMIPLTGAMAQQAQNQGQQTQQNQSQGQNQTIAILPASDLTGRSVVDPQDRNAGRIDSMIIDSQNGAVEYVLIGGRGNFDLGGHLAAVPWSVLQQPGPQGPVALKIGANQLAQAPLINRNLLYELNSPGWRSRIYGYFGPYAYGPYAPYYGYWYGAYRAPVYPPYAVAGQPQGAQTGQQSARQEQGQQQAQSQQNPQNQGSAGLSVSQNGVVSVLASPSSVSPTGLRSALVFARNGDQIGQIDQVLIDTERGKVAYILLKRGGFLGLNPTWFALPIQTIVWSPFNPGYGYRLTVNEQLLDGVPPVPVNQQHLTTKVPRQELAQLYQHFGIEPYWTGGSGQASNQASSRYSRS